MPRDPTTGWHRLRRGDWRVLLPRSMQRRNWNDAIEHDSAEFPQLQRHGFGGPRWRCVACESLFAEMQ